MHDIFEKIKDIITDSIKFWESGRLIYNGVLVLIVIGYFCTSVIQGKPVFFIEYFISLLIMALIANILFCTAYIIDIFVQVSAFQTIWRKYRWILLLTGILIATVFACLASDSLFLC